jgi:hypothetical protein
MELVNKLDPGCVLLGLRLNRKAESCYSIVLVLGRQQGTMLSSMTKDVCPIAFNIQQQTKKGHPHFERKNHTD